MDFCEQFILTEMSTDNHIYILCLESSTQICSVSLSKDGKTIASKDAAEGQKHSKWMTVFIEELLAEANIKIDQLHAIAVSQGPGSYTGLRVAYSIAKGIAFRLSIPIIEVPTLEALGQSFTVDQEQSYCVVSTIDARRMEVYWRVVNHEGECLVDTEAHIYSATSMDAFLVYDIIYIIGDGAEKVHELEWAADVRDRIRVEKHLTFASNLAHLAHDKYTKEQFGDVAYCTPFYLKSPRITTSKKTI